MMNEKQSQHDEVWKQNLWMQIHNFCIVFQEFWNSMLWREQKNSHNIETCNSKTVGPANRSFPENTKRIELKQQHQQITNNDKLRKNKGEWCEVTAQTSRWRQTLRLVSNNAITVYIIFYSILGCLMSQVLHLSSWFKKARHILHLRLASIMFLQWSFGKYLSSALKNAFLF